MFRTLVLGLSLPLFAAAAAPARHKVPPDPGDGPVRPVRRDLYGDRLPPGAVARCGSLLSFWEFTFGKAPPGRTVHRAAVTRLTWAPGGRLLASCDALGDFRVWERATGKQVVPAPGRLVRACDFAFSEEGKFLTVVDANAVARVWELRQGRQVRTFPVRTPGVRTEIHSYGRGARWLAFDSRGRTLAVAREDSLDLWDPLAGKRLCRIPSGQDYECAEVFSSDGRFLVSAVFGEHPRLRLREVSTGKLLRELPRRLDDSMFCAFSPDSKVLAWGWDKEVRLWDLTRRVAMRSLKVPYPPNISFAANGKVLRWNIAFHRTSQHLVIQDQFQTVSLWDVATGRPLRRMISEGAPPPREGGPIQWATHLAPHGDTVFVFMILDPDEGRFALRDVETCRDVALLPCPALSDFSPACQVVALGDTTVRLLEVATGTEIVRLPRGQRGGVTSLAFSPDGKLLATGGCDGTILIWDWLARCGSVKRGTDTKALWEDLGSKDATVAYRAIDALAADPCRAIGLLKEKLRPVGEQDVERVRRLLAQLESHHFPIRRRAQAALERLGLETVPLVTQCMPPRPSLETRRRVEQALEAPALRRWSHEMVRQFRALHALELAGTPEAKQLLGRVASGIPEARLTQEAKAALARLNRKAAAASHAKAAKEP